MNEGEAVPTLGELQEEASGLRDCPAWLALETHAEAISTLQLGDLLDEPDRYRSFSRQLEDFILDFSRNLVTTESLELLLQLARERHLEAWVDCLFSGTAVNSTEDRPALHTALRHPPDRSVLVDGLDVAKAVNDSQRHLLEFAETVRTGRYKGFSGARITDVVNIGIGGSDLGLVLVTEALRTYQDEQIRSHFVSNIDGTQLADVLDRISAESSLFIICSKSFTTQETKLNAEAARAWFLEQLPQKAIGQHFLAVSANDDAMDQFGIAPEHRFRIWDWVGGRYSLWSAVGLSIAIALGADNFRDLLAGAARMDEHFRTSPLTNNLPVLLGLIGIWNQNFLGATNHAVLPYDQRLYRLPAFLQQLDMESNGKGVTCDGVTVDYSTGVLVWGEPGSNAQHSFFQLLHQGTARGSIDFLAPVAASSHFQDQHQQGLVNMLAQAEAFARGHSADAVRSQMMQAGFSPAEIERLTPHKTHRGNRSSNILLFKKLDPPTLGLLIALYEHKVFVQSVIWGINPFDQWGVELGKVMASGMSEALFSTGDHPELPGIAAFIKAWADSDPTI